MEEFNSSILKLEKVKNMKRHFNDDQNFRKYLSPVVAYRAESEMFYLMKAVMIIFLLLFFAKKMSLLKYNY